MRTLEELLRELGAASAHDVELSALPAHAGSDAQVVQKATDARTRAVVSGACVASYGGRSTTLTGAEAAALRAAVGQTEAP